MRAIRATVRSYLRFSWSFCYQIGPRRPLFWKRVRTQSLIISLSDLKGSEAEEFLVLVPEKIKQ